MRSRLFSSPTSTKIRCIDLDTSLKPTTEAGLAEAGLAEAGLTVNDEIETDSLSLAVRSSWFSSRLITGATWAIGSLAWDRMLPGASWATLGLPLGSETGREGKIKKNPMIPSRRGTAPKANRTGAEN